MRDGASAFRLLLWLVLLVAVAVATWTLLSAHYSRVRGIPRDFPTPVNEADVPTLGVNVNLDRYEEPGLTSALARVADGGFVWVRQSFVWSQVRRDGSVDEFEWANVDRFMDALQDYAQLRLVAVLEDKPPVPPEDSERFAAFAGAFAERYGAQIDYYQIWDEPNLAAHWGGDAVSPSAYADLLARSAEAIRAADPDARILLAGLAPTAETGPRNLSEMRYLEQLYRLGAARYFDIVAAKPYGFDSGPAERRAHESVLNASRLLLLREMMVEYDDAGTAIWATQWGWNALPEAWSGAPSIWGQTDEATQAAHSAAMLDRARDEWPWMGAMIIETLQPDAPPSPKSVGDLEDPRWGFALLAPDGTPRPVYHALAAWSRSLPDAAPVGGYPVRNRWAMYEGNWRLGTLQADVGPSPVTADGNRARFSFDGTRVALTVHRGPNRAFLYVTVDGEPANALPRDERGRAYVVLYDTQSSLATVPLATDLKPGAHAVEVVVEGGQGQWPLVDWRVGATPVRDGTSWKLAALAAVGLLLLGLLVRDIRRVSWSSLASTYLRLPPAAQAGLVIGLVGVLWTTAALSWARLTPHVVVIAACFVLSILTLPVLAFLFASRLDLGLALVALVAPFYLVPDGMFYRALSLPELLVVLCFVAYIVQSLHPQLTPSDWPADPQRGESTPRHRARPTEIDAALMLMLLSALVAGAAADDRLAALFELRSVFLLPALYYALLRLTPLDRSARQWVVGGFLVGGVGVALVGLGQVALGRNLVAAEGGVLRLQSVYHSPNSLGLYLGRVWPFLAAGALRARTGYRRTLLVVALILVTVALGLSFSRGALLMALPASVLAMGWWVGGRYRRLALALVAVGSLVLIPLLRLPRFAGLLDLGRGTTFFRLKLWRSSLLMIRDHPFLGVGPGNFLSAYRTRYVLPTAWEEFNLEHAHNLLLDHWTRLGLLGFIAGLFLQIAFWRRLRRPEASGALTLALVGSMAALLAHGLVDNAVFFPDLALTFFLMLALSQEGSEGARRGGDDKRRTKDEILDG